MNDDYYYNKQDITLLVTYRIRWDKADPEARADAIRIALNLPISGGGAGRHGCYDAERLEVRVDD